MARRQIQDVQIGVPTVVLFQSRRPLSTNNNSLVKLVDGLVNVSRIDLFRVDETLRRSLSRVVLTSF